MRRGPAAAGHAEAPRRALQRNRCRAGSVAAAAGRLEMERGQRRSIVLPGFEVQRAGQLPVAVRGGHAARNGPAAAEDEGDARVVALLDRRFQRGKFGGRVAARLETEAQGQLAARCVRGAAAAGDEAGTLAVAVFESAAQLHQLRGAVDARSDAQREGQLVGAIGGCGEARGDEGGEGRCCAKQLASAISLSPGTPILRPPSSGCRVPWSS